MRPVAFEKLNAIALLGRFERFFQSRLSIDNDSREGSYRISLEHIYEGLTGDDKFAARIDEFTLEHAKVIAQKISSIPEDKTYFTFYNCFGDREKKRGHELKPLNKDMLAPIIEALRSDTSHITNLEIIVDSYTEDLGENLSNLAAQGRGPESISIQVRSMDLQGAIKFAALLSSGGLKDKKVTLEWSHAPDVELQASSQINHTILAALYGPNAPQDLSFNLHDSAGVFDSKNSDVISKLNSDVLLGLQAGFSAKRVSMHVLSNFTDEHFTQLKVALKSASLPSHFELSGIDNKFVKGVRSIRVPAGKSVSIKGSLQISGQKCDKFTLALEVKLKSQSVSRSSLWRRSTSTTVAGTSYSSFSNS
jgi:hypothetical protein